MGPSRGVVSLFPSPDKMTPTRLSIETSLSPSSRSPPLLHQAQSAPATTSGAPYIISKADSSYTAHPSSNHERHPSLTVPASPTLSNPDLILPSYNFGDDADFEIRDWKPSLRPIQLQLQLQEQLDSHQFESDELTPTSTTALAGADIFAGFSSETPADSILYGNGTMLSDIGEVTENESWPGGDKRTGYFDAGISDKYTFDEDDDVATPVRSSFDHPKDDAPSLRAAAAIAAATPTGASIAAMRTRVSAIRRQRSGSAESTSSTTTLTDDEGQHFDSVEDMRSNASSSNCQGDDEGSVDGSPKREKDVDRYSTASLSARAEAILANAKKRLNNMETNLNRARSLHSSGVSSPESTMTVSSGGIVHHHPSARYRAQSSASRHFRMLSEDTIQANERAARGPTRSVSALGTLSLPPPPSAMTTATPSGFRPLLLASRSADTITRQRRNPGLELNLAPLKEVSISAAIPYQERAPSVATASSHPRGFDIMSPTSSTFSDHSFGSPRPRSIRDIKDHMNELRGKVSLLREQARSDTLRRRSIQSMRTPSPFTHAGYEAPSYSAGERAESPAARSEKHRPDDASVYSRQSEEPRIKSTYLTLDDPPHFNDAMPTPKAFQFPAPPSGRSPTLEESGQSESDGGAPTDYKNNNEEDYREEDYNEKEYDGHPEYKEYLEDYDPHHGIGEAHGGESIAGVDDEYLDVNADGSLMSVSHAVARASSIYDGGVNIDVDVDVDETLPAGFSYDQEAYAEYDGEFDHPADNDYGLDNEAEVDVYDNQEEEDKEGNDNDEYDAENYADDSDTESLYHDTVQAHLSHEDREDAFDYERFFLHSAMGSFTQERLAGRSRSNTLGSGVSIETARATTALDRPHKRQSMATVASYDTTASFATADDGSSEDGRYEDDDHFEDYDEYNNNNSGRLSRPILSTRPATVAQMHHHHHRPTISVDAPGLSRSYSAAVMRTGAHKTALSVNDAGRAVTNGGGILTPRGSPDPLRQLNDSLMGETGSLSDVQVADPRTMLSREDQLLVERVVAGLGKCILALSEAGRASAEGRQLRRRLEGARRVLEGFDV